jgi:NAD+ synthase
MTEKEALKQIDVCVDFIREYFKDNGTPNTKAVIGISGGKDSTIAAALLVRALGPERVVGVMMPNGTQNDINDAISVCQLLGIENYILNIGQAYDGLIKTFIYDGDLAITDQIATNTPARLRMTTLYMVAAAVGGRVCNTGNASEAFIGYTTKYGDLAGDFALLKNLTVREIYAMGDAMSELPYKLVHKSPADGMSGKTDEDNTGIPYEVIDAFLLEDIIPKDINVYEKMLVAHDRNLHKRCINLPAPYRVGRHLTQRSL